MTASFRASLARHATAAFIIKYRDQRAYDRDDPEEVTPPADNTLAPAGVTLLWKLVAGLGGGNEFYSTMNTYIAVGDSAASVVSAPGQPWNLQGSNVAYQAVDAGYPIIPALNSDIPGYTGTQPTVASYNTCVWQATFGPNSGNGFAWRELAIVNGPSITQPPTPTRSLSAPYTNSTLPSTGTMLNRVIAPDPVNGFGTKVPGTIWVAIVPIAIS